MSFSNTGYVICNSCFRRQEPLAKHGGQLQAKDYVLLQLKWEFNDGAGFTDADDKLAECMHQDAIGNPPTVFDVPREIIQAAKQRMPARDDLFAGKASG